MSSSLAQNIQTWQSLPEDQCFAYLRDSTLPHCDLRAFKKLKKAFEALPISRYRPIKIALLFLGTEKPLIDYLQTCLYANQLRAEFYLPDYGSSMQAILEPESDLYQFDPDFIFCLQHWRDILSPHELEAWISEPQTLAQKKFEELEKIWEYLLKYSSSIILQNDIDIPPHRPLGQLEVIHPHSQTQTYNALNQLIYQYQEPRLHIHSLHQLACELGQNIFHDPRFFQQAKIHPNPEVLGHYAWSLSRKICGILSLNKKCIITDLDGTLWGGILGEDGLQGILTEPGDPTGEAHLAYQHFLKEHQQRGTLLAICSKNDDDLVHDCLSQNTNLLLSEKDFVDITANWENKADNIKKLSEKINLGLDSFIFIDDTPHERDWVRRALPEVCVPELPIDVSTWPQQLAQLNYFEAPTLEAEDLNRHQLYKNRDRTLHKPQGLNLEDYLKGLEMTLQVGEVQKDQFNRCLQLTNKTNQFNLCTERLSAAQLQEKMESPHWIILYARLIDRLGDNGIISLLYAQHQSLKSTLRIENFLMSCRVLNRRVEFAFLKSLLEFVQDKDISMLETRFIPTKRNSMVKDLWPKLGMNPSQQEGLYQIDPAHLNIPKAPIQLEWIH